MKAPRVCFAHLATMNVGFCSGMCAVLGQVGTHARLLTFFAPQSPEVGRYIQSIGHWADTTKNWPNNPPKLARHCPRLAPTYPQHGLKMSEVRPWAAPKKLPTKRNFRLWNLQDPVLYPKHAADRTKKWPKQTHQRPNNAHDWPIPSKWA